ncbi:MAG TPA: glycosyltransferase family 1 protein [Candidatus Acidoferrales bacterium]|nr:glycosyltransferase family 1 protein [Candidatus Acidoferrales bacterium]
MRIGIGAIVGIVGGPATYAKELIRALARIDTLNEYVVFADAPDRFAAAPPNVAFVRAALGSSFQQPWWDHVTVPKLVRRSAVDLYHGTKGVLPRIGSCPEVLTIHDLAFYKQPRTFSFLQRLHLQAHTPYSVRRARRIIAVSESARDDLLERFEMPASRVVVVPEAVSDRFRAAPTDDDETVVRRLGLPDRFLLYAGTIQPRKNVEMLVEAFSGLADAGGVELILCGRIRPGYHPSFLTSPSPRVRYLGLVTDDELAVLYRRALALCSPSSYEGFGLSLLEAMTSGCLVIAGRNSSVTELVENTGILLPALSVETVRDALARVLQADPVLDELRRAAMKRAGHYSWDTAARQTLEVYRAVWEESHARP